MMLVAGLKFGVKKSLTAVNKLIEYSDFHGVPRNRIDETHGQHCRCTESNSHDISPGRHPNGACGYDNKKQSQRNHGKYQPFPRELLVS